MLRTQLWLSLFVSVLGGVAGDLKKYYGNLEGRRATVCMGGTLKVSCTPDSDGFPRIIVILDDWNLTRSACKETCCPSLDDDVITSYKNKDGSSVSRSNLVEVNNIMSQCRYLDKCTYAMVEEDDDWFVVNQGNDDRMTYLSFYYVCVQVNKNGQECYNDGLKRDYSGTLAVSRDGTSCEKWSEVIDSVSNYITPLWFPDTLTDNGYDLERAENYCRNPGQLENLYCFVNVAMSEAPPDYQIMWCNLTQKCEVTYISESVAGVKKEARGETTLEEKWLGLRVKYWIIIGSGAGLLLLIIIVGILVKFTCFKRTKADQVSPPSEDFTRLDPWNGFDDVIQEEIEEEIDDISGNTDNEREFEVPEIVHENVELDAFQSGEDAAERNSDWREGDTTEVTAERDGAENEEMRSDRDAVESAGMTSECGEMKANLGKDGGSLLDVPYEASRDADDDRKSNTSDFV